MPNVTQDSMRESTGTESTRTDNQTQDKQDVQRQDKRTDTQGTTQPDKPKQGEQPANTTNK